MTTAPLPPLPSLSVIEARLKAVFTDAGGDQAYCTREVAAKTVFTMLYVGAVDDGGGRYLAPKHVVRMTPAQTAKHSDAARLAYARECMTPGYAPSGRTWYADNSREQIRDETLRKGFQPVGAVVEKPGLATTSPRPRYALAPDFAALFDTAASDQAVAAKVRAWQEAHLSPGALHRMRLLDSATAQATSGIALVFPDGTQRKMPPGESSQITKAVVEQFANTFLTKPAVVFVSDSQHIAVAHEVKLAHQIGLDINQAALVPDVVLVDLGTSHKDLLLVFVEVVASDGPMTEQRRTELMQLARSTKLPDDQVAFVTAYMDRGKGAGRASVGRLAWNTFLWFATEPDAIVALHRVSSPATLRGMMKAAKAAG